MTGQARLVVALTLGLVLGILFLPWIWMLGVDPPADWRHAAWGILGMGGVILALRGATDLSPALWLFLLSAYPVAAPLLSLDVLGYDAFASGTRTYQSPQAITVPVLLGASASCLLALHLPTTRIGPVSQSGARALSPHGALLLFGLAVLGLLLASAWDAPPSLRRLGEIGYRDLKAARDDVWNIASGLVFVFGALATMALRLVLAQPHLGARLRLWGLLGFVVVAVLCVSWQILSASRIEAAGLLLLIYVSLGARVPVALRLALAAATIGLLALVGYVRTLAGLLAYLSRDFVSWPGGVENVFNTYAYGLNALRHGEIDLQFGQTYLHLIQRLPPKFFAPDRPPRAYDLVADQTRLIGGEFYLTEPYLNAAGLGVLIFVGGLIWAYRAALRSLAPLTGAASGMVGQFLALVLFTVCFRLFWYGLEHGIKVLMLALLVAIPLALFQHRPTAAGLRIA